MRGAGLGWLLVVLHVGRLVAAVVVGLIPAGVLLTQVWVPAPVSQDGARAARVLVDVPDIDQRMLLMVGLLPLLLVILVSLTQAIRVTEAVRAGDPFQPAVAARLRTLATTLWLFGTVAQIIADQVRQAVGRHYVHTESFTFVFPFTWIIAALLVGLVGAIVQQGVQRSMPGPPYSPGPGSPGPGYPPAR